LKPAALGQGSAVISVSGMEPAGSCFDNDLFKPLAPVKQVKEVDMISDNYNFGAINKLHPSYLLHTLKVSSISKTFDEIRASLLKIIFLSEFSRDSLKF
jgi:hypothetical protein